MNQDEYHLRLLSIFHYIVGGLGALFSCFPLIHVGLGIAMLLGKLEGKNPPPRIFAWFFILIPSVIVICGWALSVCVIIAGTKLARHKARFYCLVIAAIECVLVPFGTILGAFTIAVLMKDSVKELFSARQAVPPLP